MYVDKEQNYYLVSDFEDVDGVQKTAIYASDENGEIIDICEMKLSIEVDTPEAEMAYMKTAYNAEPFDEESNL